ncbi:MAG: triose-phosphate isomerase, partial [Dehalococcoidia bacterium]
GALKGIESPQGLVIAYEPIWAIGTGRAATPEEANITIAIIRNSLSQLYGDGIALETRILYGGSVTAANIFEFIIQPEIDGALVGGASLKADEFLSIVEQSVAITR